MVRPKSVEAEEASSGVAGAQALGKGFSLLNLIADAPHPMRFTDLLNYSGLPKGTLHRLLGALQEVRFLKLDERDQTFRLGHRIFEMAHRVWSDFDLRGAAEPELERLRTLSQETARLGLLDGDSVLIIDQREFLRPIRLGNGVGSRVLASASAIGKVILAYRAPEEIAVFLKEWELGAPTPNSISNPTEFQSELDLIKARGYAVSIEEQFVGVSAVAAPVLDHRGQSLGAISITGPSNRLTPEMLHTLGREVIEAARRTSGNIGETFMSTSSPVIPSRVSASEVNVAVPSSAFLGEGPVWLKESNALLWVDILAPGVNLSNIDAKSTRSTSLNEIIGAIVPRRRGGFVAATQSGFRSLDLQTGDMIEVASPTGMSGRRFNDAKCDPRGRLWAGTLALDAAPGQGALFRLDADRTLSLIEKGFDICNGMGWSPDGSIFYLVDTGARVLYAYDYDLDEGGISNRRVLTRFDDADGVPDGVAVDAEGAIWCAMWDGWAVRRYLPDGQLDRVVAVPVPRPTSCAFGGPDLKTLYITSARIRLSAVQLAAAPLSGSIFEFRADVPGTPVSAFAG
jgi:sugar lactone lactonase YvrE/DNA-binding IclR family transcriptional regulator